MYGPQTNTTKREVPHVATLGARNCLLKVGWQAILRRHPAGKDGAELLAVMRAAMLIAMGANEGEEGVEGIWGRGRAHAQETAARPATT